MMKKSNLLKGISVSILVFMLLFAGCAKSETAVMQDFSSIIKASASVETLDKATKFIDRSAKGISPQGMSTIVLAYVDKVEQFIIEREDDAKVCASIGAKGVGEYLMLMDSSGRRVEGEAAEGEISVVPDYGKIAERYGSGLHEDLIEFLELKAEAERLPYLTSGSAADYMSGLVYTYRLEKLIKTHTGKDMLRQGAVDMFSEGVNRILTGSENLPIFDKESGEFPEEARSAYEDFAVQKSDSVLSDMLSEYFDYLNSVGWILDKGDPVAVKTFEDTVSYFHGKAMSAVTR